MLLSKEQDVKRTKRAGLPSAYSPLGPNARRAWIVSGIRTRSPGFVSQSSTPTPYSILSFSAWGQPNWFQQGRVLSCARPPKSRFLGPRALQVRQCSLCKTTIPKFGRRQETQATHECGIYHGEIKLDNVSIFAEPESPLPLRCEKSRVWPVPAWT